MSNMNQPPPYGAPPPGYGQNMPPPGYGQPSAHSQTTVVMQQPQVVMVQTFGEMPIQTKCPACRADVITATYYESGSMTWLFAILLCFIGGLLCCCIPFLVDGCKDVVHQCPNCQSQLGRFNRM